MPDQRSHTNHENPKADVLLITDTDVEARADKVHKILAAWREYK